MSSFRLIGSIKRFFRQDADYFKNNKKRIEVHNAKLLRAGCILYGCVLVFYTLMTWLFSDSQLHLYMYLGFDAAHIALTIIVFVRARKDKEYDKLTPLFCGILEFTLLAFFAAEAVFPYPLTHSFYVPIPILLIMLVLIHRAKNMMGTIVLYTVSYAVAAYLYKGHDVGINDIYIAIATMIASLIGCVLVCQIRHREGFATQRLEYLSTMDQLTGIYNRQTIEAICQGYLSNSNRESIVSFAIVVLDLDNFKEINDKYGHSVGDQVLTGFGHMLKSTFYDKDNVGRFGGDEFIVLMVNDAGTVEQVQNKMDTVMELAGQIDIPDMTEKVSCSIGIAYVSDGKTNTESFDELFIRADKALYTAKENGKDKVVIG